MTAPTLDQTDEADAAALPDAERPSGSASPAGSSSSPMSTLHFLNHALGLISVAAMESGLAIQKAIWQSLPGALVLYAALLTHMSLGFSALYERRQFRWTRLEATQLVLGLDDPVSARRSRIRHAGRPQPVRG